MSNINNEAQTAQDEYEMETGNEQPISTNVPTEQQQEQVRSGWKFDGKFWIFENYFKLPDAYKKFLPAESTEGKLNPGGPPAIVHVDPLDGKTYKYWIAFFPNGGSRISSVEWNPSRSYSTGSGGSGGYQRKSFYMDIGCDEYSLSEANAMLSANENDRVYRYKPDGRETHNVTTKHPDGTVTMESKRIYILLKQKRIEFG